MHCNALLAGNDCDPIVLIIYQSDQNGEKALLTVCRPEKGHMVAIWTGKTKMQLDW